MTNTALESAITIPRTEWDAHVKRVEVVFDLVSALMAGLAQHPMASAFLPPDVLQSMREGS